MVNLNKPVTTRDGNPVRILVTDRKNTQYPVVGLVTQSWGKGAETVGVWTIDGKSTSHGDGSDLVNIKTKKTGWANIYRNFAYIHPTRELADVHNNNNSRIDCVPIEWEEAE